MIKNTHELGGEDVLSAYSDNAAVVKGHRAGRFYPEPGTAEYQYHQEDIHLLMKVETHNHPTAISPFSGAGTGSGGEIRDEGAVGRGSKPKVGLSGFSVSNLRVPGFEQPWEADYGKPGRIVSALDIMLDGPIGGPPLIMSLADLIYVATSAASKKMPWVRRAKSVAAITSR